MTDSSSPETEAIQAEEPKPAPQTPSAPQFSRRQFLRRAAAAVGLTLPFVGGVASLGLLETKRGNQKTKAINRKETTESKVYSQNLLENPDFTKTEQVLVNGKPKILPSGWMGQPDYQKAEFMEGAGIDGANIIAVQKEAAWQNTRPVLIDRNFEHGVFLKTMVPGQEGKPSQVVPSVKVYLLDKNLNQVGTYDPPKHSPLPSNEWEEVEFKVNNKELPAEACYAYLELGLKQAEETSQLNKNSAEIQKVLYSFSHFGPKHSPLNQPGKA